MCQSETKQGNFTGEWFCLGCQTAVSPETVTFDEMHEVCGGAAVWRTSVVIGEAEAVIRIDDKPDRTWMAKRIEELEKKLVEMRDGTARLVLRVGELEAENLRLLDRLARAEGSKLE